MEPWYGDIIIYLRTLKVPPHLSWDERRCLGHVSKNYLIIYDTLYRRGVDSILRRCLTHEEDEIVLNDFHRWVCGGNLSGFDTSHKVLREGYY